eukprot:193083-Prymnesium_polylepis.1
MMIWDNLIHADLHPGNVLIRMEEIGTQPPRGSEGAGGSVRRGRRPAVLPPRCVAASRHRRAALHPCALRCDVPMSMSNMSMSN